MFNTGYLKPEEIENIFNSIPGEVTFTDKDNIVRYFSKGDERIFTRTKAVIGRNVENCHPPASVHIVDKLVEDFRTGKKDSEDFGIKMGERFILIRFFAVRNKDGEFLGTLEFAQDIAPIEEITGEKRLLED